MARDWQKSKHRKVESVESTNQPLRLLHTTRITEQVWPEGTVPVVSVLCITYNHEKFIRGAIEGFLMQETTFPVEIFIHDDASTDGTAGIVKEYADKYPQLFWTVLQTENQWSKGNRKILFDYLVQQRGEFIALCEGDDYWTSPQKLQKQVMIMQSGDNIALTTSDVDVLHDRTGKLVKSVFRRMGNIPKNNEDLTSGLLTRKYIFITCTFLLRTSMCRDMIKNDPYAFCGKWPFGDAQIMLECSRRGRIHFIPESLATYRKLAESAAHSRNPEHHALNTTALLECFEYYNTRFNYGPAVAAIYRASLISSLAIVAAASKNEVIRLQVHSLVNTYRFQIRNPVFQIVFWSLRSNRRMRLVGPCALSILNGWLFLRKFLIRVTLLLRQITVRQYI